VTITPKQAENIRLYTFS